MISSTGLELDEEEVYHLRFFEDYGDITIFEGVLIGGGTEFRKENKYLFEMIDGIPYIKHEATGHYLAASDEPGPDDLRVPTHIDGIILSESIPKESTRLILEHDPKFKSIFHFKRTMDDKVASCRWLKIAFGDIRFEDPATHKPMRFQFVPEDE